MRRVAAIVATCRRADPGSWTSRRSTTTRCAAGPSTAQTASTRFAGRSSTRDPIPSSARSTTTGSTSPCATTGPSRGAAGRTHRVRDRRRARLPRDATRRARLRAHRPLRVRAHRPGRADRRDGSPGQHIGWTCQGDWHVHLSEFVFTSGPPIVVNPLRPGGKVRPYVDDGAAEIREIRFYSPGDPAWSRRPTTSVARLPPAGMRIARDRPRRARRRARPRERPAVLHRLVRGAAVARRAAPSVPARRQDRRPRRGRDRRRREAFRPSRCSTSRPAATSRRAPSRTSRPEAA